MFWYVPFYKNLIVLRHGDNNFLLYFDIYIFFVSQVPSFKHTKQTNQNVADTIPKRDCSYQKYVIYQFFIQFTIQFSIGV